MTVDAETLAAIGRAAGLCAVGVCQAEGGVEGLHTCVVVKNLSHSISVV